jgi:hypothetical protein
MTWADRSVGPEREYCYRVAALVGEKAGAFEAGCTTTPALAPMTCTDDPKDNRSQLVEILESPDPFWVDWRDYVGLVDADPSRLVLIEDDSICNALWSEASRGDAEAYALIAFFRLGNRYIVTDYVNADPSFGPVGVGESITTVLDDRMRAIVNAVH